MPSERWTSWLAAAVLAPTVSLKSLSGKPVSTASLNGAPALVEFWATWCESCRESVALCKDAAARYGSRGLRVVGIDEGERPKDAAAFAKREGISYEVWVDPSKEAFDAFGARGLPTLLLLGKDGRIVGRWDGFSPATPAQVESSLR